MSVDKYSTIFLRQMEAIFYIYTYLEIFSHFRNLSISKRTCVNVFGSSQKSVD